jgi:hypothetical protein
MDITRRWMEDFVMRVQGAFLDAPRLALSARDAPRRFGIDATICDAVLAFLVEAHVLTKTQDGVYIRHVPRTATRYAA